MADIVDYAATLVDAHVAAGLARIERDIPAGVPGECEECGEPMPRLVGGRCGFCRDGRRPPADQYPCVPTIKTKEKIMANLPPSADRRQISFPATGAVLEAIMRGAEGSSIAQATLELLNRGIAPTSAPSLTITSRGDLTDFDTEELLVELRDRATGNTRVRDLEADLVEANARVAAAEGKLAMVSSVLAGTQ